MLPGIRSEDISSDVRYSTLQWQIGTTGPTISCLDSRLHSIIFLGGFVSADVMFDVSPDGDNWYPLYDGDGEYKLPAAVVNNNRCVVVDAMTFYGHRLVRPRLTGAQSADRSITVGMYPR